MRWPPRIADSIELGGPPDGQTSQLFDARLTLVGAAVLVDTAGEPPTVPLAALLGPPAPPPVDGPPPPRPLPLEDVVDGDDVVVELP